MIFWKKEMLQYSLTPAELHQRLQAFCIKNNYRLGEFDAHFLLYHNNYLQIKNWFNIILKPLENNQIQIVARPTIVFLSIWIGLVSAAIYTLINLSNFNFQFGRIELNVSFLKIAIPLAFLLPIFYGFSMVKNLLDLKEAIQPGYQQTAEGHVNTFKSFRNVTRPFENVVFGGYLLFVIIFIVVLLLWGLGYLDSINPQDWFKNE
jgi:hypothetical protein